jgi:hypothetical protein
MLSGIPLIAMTDFTDVESVLQEVVERTSREGVAASLPTISKSNSPIVPAGRGLTD